MFEDLALSPSVVAVVARVAVWKVVLWRER